MGGLNDLADAVIPRHKQRYFHYQEWVSIPRNDCLDLLSENKIRVQGRLHSRCSLIVEGSVSSCRRMDVCYLMNFD